MTRGRLSFAGRRVLARALRRPLRGRRQAWLLLVGVLLIAVWQWSIYRRAGALDAGYMHRGAIGMNFEPRFVYFLYYLGLFPVVANEGHLDRMATPGYKKFSRAAAERLIADRGHTLGMEVGNTVRAGDLGRTFLYLPHALWKGTARDPSLRPTHAAAFTLALASVYAAFWAVRDPLLGALTVALLGSNPYQLYEAHVRENVFSWAITTGLLAFALNLPLLTRRPPAGALPWVLAAATGLVLGTVRQLRPEPVTILASVAAAYLLLARASWLKRAALIALLGAAFFLTTRGWQAFFDHKIQEASRIVAAAGGHVYQGPRDRYHTFWHPLWCGLGDFDRKYGYKWSDNAAAEYAEPIVAERRRQARDEYHDRWLYWDPVYEAVLRDKIVHDIVHDPLWYLEILVRRAGKVLTRTTPVQIVLPGHPFTLPWTGLAVVPLVAVFVWTRSWFLAKAALFPLGTSLPAILVFSGADHTMTYSGWFHFVAAASFLAVSLALVASFIRRSRRHREAA